VHRQTLLALSLTHRPYHDPFNLALPAYNNKDGIVEAGDYNWDQSYVGNYDTSTLAAAMPELVTAGAAAAAAAANNGDGVQEGTETVAGLQRKYASAGGAPMLATPNCELFTSKFEALELILVLLPWFPTQEERSLILHYCANAADLMMAIPSGLNPMLAINLPLALDSPRGESVNFSVTFKADN